PIFKVPLEKDESFTAREDIIRDIEEKFKSKQSEPVALTGIGGIGKSHIAVEYCYRFKKRHPDSSVIWVYSGTTTRFNQEYKEIARQLELPGSADRSINNIVNLVRGWLSDNHGWLMVIDNADIEEGFLSSGEVKGSNKSLDQCIPRPYRGQILITSRNKKVANIMVEKADRIINVNPMSGEEAESLLQKKLPKGTDSGDIPDLARVLEKLPLAITQAAAYISKNELVSISDYLSMFRINDKQQAELLEEDAGARPGDDNAPRTVLDTWSLSFQQIRRTSPQAAGLLSLMCFLDPQKIPGFLLAGDVEFSHIIRDINPLIDFSFVSLVKEEDKKKKNFQMHHMVQVAMKRWLHLNAEFEEWQEKALKLVSKRFRSGEYENIKSWEERQILTPHIEKILSDEIEAKTEETDLMRASLMHNFSCFIWRQGQYKASLQRSQDSLKFRKERLKNHPELMLESKALIGLVLNSLGRYGEAVDVHRQVLERRKITLGDEHLDTLRSMNDLGQALRNQREFKKAEHMHRVAIEGRKRFLGMGAEDTLTSMNDLAGVLADLRDFSAAELMYRDVLELEEKMLGKEHPSTLTTREHLAEVLTEQKKYEEAEKAHREVLALYVMLFSKKKPGYPI
ncbi:P-loop containing nucleoside triphosphate hydrolase protein, partial [Tricladium varicosporioides]